jgi:hypothetical protein
MGQAKDDFIERTGGFRSGETRDDFQKRVSRIDELETQLRSGTLRMRDLEKVQRELCSLKGIDFDSDEE